MSAAAPNAKPAAACAANAHAPPLAVSGEEAQYLSLPRAPRRAGCDLLRPYERALHRRKASLLRHAAVVRRVRCRLQRQAGCRVCSKQQAHRRCFSLSLARRRSTRACCARAPRCAGCGRPVPYRRVLHRQEASLLGAQLWCGVLTAASNAKPAAASAASAQAPALAISLSLRRRRSTRACCARAPRYAGCGRPVPYRRVLHRQ